MLKINGIVSGVKKKNRSVYLETFILKSAIALHIYCTHFSDILAFNSNNTIPVLL